MISFRKLPIYSKQQTFPGESILHPSIARVELTTLHLRHAVFQWSTVSTATTPSSCFETLKDYRQ
jgi:hypothetical protein